MVSNLKKYRSSASEFYNLAQMIDLKNKQARESAKELKNNLDKALSSVDSIIKHLEDSDV